MIKQKTYAAIDIGSNAVRLLVSTITEKEGMETNFRKKYHANDRYYACLQADHEISWSGKI